jgi:hypothetical protein
VTSTPSTTALRRRIVVIAAGTVAVGALSAVAPAPVIEAASAATTTSTGIATTTATSTVTAAGQVAASGTASALVVSAPVAASAPTVRKAPVVTRVTTTAVATVAPYRFGTVNYAKWWAKRLLAIRYHVTSTTQFACLVTVWNRESHWNYKAHNTSSGAYGIPQALPGSKMRTAGTDWRSNPVTQIKWGLGYIKNRYGSACGALRHMNSHGWY